MYDHVTYHVIIVIIILLLDSLQLCGTQRKVFQNLIINAPFTLVIANRLAKEVDRLTNIHYTNEDDQLTNIHYTSPIQKGMKL